VTGGEKKKMEKEDKVRVDETRSGLIRIEAKEKKAALFIERKKKSGLIGKRGEEEKRGEAS